MHKMVFWNLNRKPLLDEVTALVESAKADIVVLAEDGAPHNTRLESLNAKQPRYQLTQSSCANISIFSRFASELVVVRHDAGHFTVREVVIPGRLPFLLVACHLPSKLWKSAQSVSMGLTGLSEIIRRYEREARHERTLVVGDLNTDPFDPGMVGINGMHAVMSRAVALRKRRKFGDYGERAFFYNPMWSLFGDEGTGPPGTYYRGGSEEVTHFWHVLDQVLVRPDLVEFLPRRSVSIPVFAGPTSLLDAAGKPSCSDHLPLVFQFDLPYLTEA